MTILLFLFINFLEILLSWILRSRSVNILWRWTPLVSLRLSVLCTVNDQDNSDYCQCNGNKDCEESGDESCCPANVPEQPGQEHNEKVASENNGVCLYKAVSLANIMHTAHEQWKRNNQNANVNNEIEPESKIRDSLKDSSYDAATYTKYQHCPPEL